MRLSQDQRRAIAPQIARAAHHEAGHALMCVLRGLPLQRAVLEYGLEELDGDEAYVFVEGHIDADTEHSDDLDSVALCLAAGPFAGAYWTYREQGGSLSRLIQEWWNHTTAESDVDELRHLLPRTSLRERDVLNHAEPIIRKHWNDVRSIAHELIDRDELSGQRIHRLIR